MPIYQTSTTLEFTEAQPETVKARIDATNESRAAAKAIKDARKQHPGRKPCSIVTVVERRA